MVIFYAFLWPVESVEKKTFDTIHIVFWYFAIFFFFVPDRFACMLYVHCTHIYIIVYSIRLAVFFLSKHIIILLHFSFCSSIQLNSY